MKAVRSSNDVAGINSNKQRIIMIHRKAEEWNRKRYPHLDGKAPKGVIPFNRPCDWCGESVEIGYIHVDKCMDEETRFWLDIFC